MKFCEIKTKTEIKEEDLKDLLCNAMEGGSSYWAKVDDYIIPEGTDTSTVEFRHIDIPFIDGCSIKVVDNEEGEEGGLLNKESMVKGLQIMADKYPWHFQNFIKDEADAETGDVFLQCSVLGDIVFG